MAKRKAKNPNEGESSDATRRSSRRKISKENELASPKKPSSSIKKDIELPKANKGRVKESGIVKEKPNTAKPDPSQNPASELPNGNASKTQQYWLMKAEPESRLERGHDIKFSIDDLAAKTEPEPWDARNNLRAMKKGDLAFFYHSSCKVPAIVGTMEIVKEHSPDFSAQDPNAPYYDPKDLEVSNPKWSVVHVEFRRKLKEPITLKELREFSGKGGPLENMQMLKQSRLSVSGVSKEEWDFLMGVIEEREGKEN